MTRTIRATTAPRSGSADLFLQVGAWLGLSLVVGKEGESDESGYFSQDG